MLCPVCHTLIEGKGKRARVAPFVARRVWGKTSLPAELYSCPDCLLQFFMPRIPIHGEQRLYANYRDADYLRERNECEPWYDTKENRRLDACGGTGRLALWCAEIRNALGYVELDDRDEIFLDYGGGRGYLLSLITRGTRYLYDISDNRLPSGVIRLQKEDLRDHEYNVILCTGLLEHISSPVSLLHGIATLMCSYTRLYLEVPVGISSPERRRQQFLQLAWQRPKIAWELLRPGGLSCWMHEHINFFNNVSLATAISRSGLFLEEIGTRPGGIWAVCSNQGAV
jgi:hypothetical protein